MNKANIFDNMPENPDEEVFEMLAHNRHVRIERILSCGQGSPETGWYDQDWAEWVMVLKGEACICFENDVTVNLSQGDYINIAPHQRHRVVDTGSNTETVWLAIHYAGT